MSTKKTTTDMEEELKSIHAELQELREKLNETEKQDLSELPSEAISRVGEVASDVSKSALEVLEHAAKVVQAVAVGAYDGAKKAIADVQAEDVQKKQEE